MTSSTLPTIITLYQYHPQFHILTSKVVINTTFITVTYQKVLNVLTILIIWQFLKKHSEKNTNSKMYLCQGSCVHLLFSLFESLFLIEENPFKIFIMLRLTTVTPLWPSKNCTTLLFIRRKHVYICTTTGLEGQVFFIKFRLWTKL